MVQSIKMCKKEIYIISIFVLALLLVMVISGCKKYADPPPYFEDNTDTVRPSSRKVLLIGIDGAVGSEYEAIKPPVLVDMKSHSKYSWEAVSDESTTDAASWKTLMSGVSYFHHRISDSTFIYTQPIGQGEHDPIAVYPSFFTYLLTSSRADAKTTFITPWQTMLNQLVPEVADKVFASDDAAVKDSTVSRLQNANQDLIVVDFDGVAKAGIADGFSASSQGYVDAVKKVDSYIGDIMKALKARPEYNKKEEWLVIIAGTHGGKGNSYGGPSQEETNVISFFYNENFQEKEFIRGGAFSGVEIKNRDAATIKAVLEDNGEDYNPGTGEQTVQIKVNGSAGNYPHFFSNEEKWPSTPGWSMFTGGGDWAISVRSTTSGEMRIQGGGSGGFNNQWHTLTVVFSDSASKRWVIRYTDGMRISITDVTSIYNNGGSVTSSSPITIGWQADKGQPAVTFYPADIMIFNTALSDEEVANGLCLKDIKQHPKYSNLIGYWPGSDGYGGRIKNLAPGRSADFVLQGAYKWNTVTDLPCTIAPNDDPNVESKLVKAVDIVPNIFYWLRVTINDTWPLEGSEFLSKYDGEFIKL